MTNTYNTLNPLGSTSAKDLSDNASNFDEGMNSLSPSFYDRFKRRRETWAGMEKLVHDFLEAMGFEATHLVYVDGTPLTVLRPTQLIDRAGSVYKVKAPAVFPVMLTGTWATDQNLLVDVVDATLRSDLSSNSNLLQGAAIVGRGIQVADTLAQALLLSGSSPSKTVFILGRLSPSDGGGGYYRIDASDVTTPSDGGYVHAMVDGSRLKLIHDGRVNVKQFGAVGDGVSDDTAAIQAASNKGSIKVFFPAGNYKITSTINIGNGTSTAVSTINGIEFEGSGAGITAAEFGPPGATVSLTWAGAVSGTMVSIKGPIYGVNITGIMLDCALLASTGISSKHLCSSTWKEVLTIRYKGDAYFWGAYQVPTAMAVGASDCTFQQVSAKYPAPGGSGATFGESSGVPGNLDVARCVWMMCEFWRDGSSSATYCMKFQFIDNCTFIECHNHGHGGSLGLGIYVLPPSGLTAFPGAMTFVNCPIIGGAGANASWTADEGFLFLPYPVGDGQPIPTANNPKQFYGISSRGDYFGGLSIGIGGTPITKHTSARAALTFGSVSAQSSLERAISVAGCQVGDTVLAAHVGGYQSLGLVLTGYVSIAGQAIVKWTNVTSGSVTAPNGDYRVDVTSH